MEASKEGVLASCCGSFSFHGCGVWLNRLTAYYPRLRQFKRTVPSSVGACRWILWIWILEHFCIHIQMAIILFIFMFTISYAWIWIYSRVKRLKIDYNSETDVLSQELRPSFEAGRNRKGQGAGGESRAGLFYYYFPFQNEINMGTPYKLYRNWNARNSHLTRQQPQHSK